MESDFFPPIEDNRGQLNQLRVKSYGNSEMQKVEKMLFGRISTWI